jgi:hypothetical protein
MNPNAVIMSGPHQGQALELSDISGIEVRMHHPTRTGVDCRYCRNDGDGPIHGAPGAIQLHYIGDIAVRA